MTTQDELVALVMAATSDRMAEIQAARTAADEAQAKAARALEEAAEMHATATRIAAQAEVDRQNLVGKQAELDQFQHTLSDHNQALNAEKIKWETIREQIDNSQMKQAAGLTSWNNELAQRETAVYAREVAVETRERAVSGLAKWNEMRLQWMHDALNAAEPPTETFVEALDAALARFAGESKDMLVSVMRDALKPLEPPSEPPASDGVKPPVPPADEPKKDAA